MSDLVKRLRIKAGMIEMGEMMAWGSDSALMREAADALEVAAPAVQGEPVGWQFYKHGKWWNGDILTKNQRKNIEKEGVRVRNVYAAPHPTVLGEPVGEAGSLPGTKGFTTAVFDSRKVPEGTRLYTAPQPAPDVPALVGALTMARETIAFALRKNAPDYFTTDADIARHVVIQRIDAALAR